MAKNKYQLNYIKELERHKILISIRNKLFLSQTELANLLNVSFVSVNRWENGHYKPTLKAKAKIIKLAEAHNILYKS